MNDVRRALLFWPAFTSALIILIVLISPLEDRSWNSITQKLSEQFAFAEADDERVSIDLPSPSLKPVTSAEAIQPLPRMDNSDAIASSESLVERIVSGHRSLLAPAETQPGSNQADLNEPSHNQPIPQDTFTLERLGRELFDATNLAQSLGTEADAPTDRMAGTSLHSRDRYQPQRDESIVFSEPVVNEPIANRLIGQESTVDVVPAKPQAAPLRESIMPKSIRNLAKIVPRNDPAQTSSDQQTLKGVEPEIIKIAPPMVTSSREKSDAIVKPAVTGNPSTWPLTPKLNEQLEQLLSSVDTAGGSPTANWIAQVQTRLRALSTLPRLGHPEAGELIAQLDVLVSQGLQTAERASDRQTQINHLQTAYAIGRRVAIWQPVWQVVSQQHESPMQKAPILKAQSVDADQIQTIVASIRNEIADTGDADGWKSFLMLDAILSAAVGDEVNQRSLTAQKVLSRIGWHGLDADHQQWLNRDSIDQLVAALQIWAQSPVDYAALLNQIERQEADAIDLAAIDIASTIQTLQFSDNPAAVKVASAVDAHYRNANIRTAISQEMLSRLIPTVAPTTVPVRTNMLGTRVKGTSQVDSELDLQLQPALGSWSLLLQAEGSVRTQSVGQRGRTAIRTRGSSNFSAATPLKITPDGVDVGDSEIDVRGRTRLGDINSQYDNWPLIGSLARTIIASKYNERSGLTSRIANRRMKTQLADGIDERLDLKVAKSSERLSNVIMGPLNSLKLQPQVIDMQTTDQRLIARYRLAADWQMGASTPRPRAPSDSLLSVQINQSAMNNVLEQVVPQGKPTTIQSAFDNTMEVFGRDQIALPTDIPNDVQIQFAKTRPITVEMEDGVLWITMRIVELSRQRGGQLTRFIVRAGYRAEIDGLRTSLVRDGHLRVSGPGMSMRQRLPIRAIFNKVFSPNHRIPLTNDAFVNAESLTGSEISQLEIRDGWLALAVSPARPNRIAVGVSNTK